MLTDQRARTRLFKHRVAATVAFLLAVPIGAIADEPVPSEIPGTFGGRAKIGKPVVVSLRPGKAQFWDGAFVERANVPSADACGVTGPCWEWTLRSNKSGENLRVGLGLRLENSTVRAWPDAAYLGSAGQPGDLENQFTLQLRSPGGEWRELRLARPYDGEIVWTSPASGDWLVRVIPTSARNVSFRMRALLERPPSPPETDGERLLPNLRIIPPFEFTFRGATNTYGPSHPSHEGKGGCMAEEHEEAIEEGFETPTACIRFSAGFENAGEGPLLLVMDCADRALSETVHPFRSRCVESDPQHFGRMVDVISNPTLQLFRVTDTQSEGFWRCCDTYEHPAGTVRFHASHAHAHYREAWAFELFRVEDESWHWQTRNQPEDLRLVSGTGKIGIDPRAEKISDWQEFAVARDCCWDDPWRVHLAPGWGDIYEYNRSGQYLNLPLDEELRPIPGTYLLVGTTNPRELLLESDYSDNKSYALIEIGPEDGDTTLEILERGYGEGPWDTERVTLGAAP